MKRLFSMILILCMAITFVPAMPATISANTRAGGSFGGSSGGSFVTPIPLPTLEPTPGPVPTSPPDECIFTTLPATDITSTSATINGYAETIRYPGQSIMADFAGYLYYRQKGETEWNQVGSWFIWSSTSMSYELTDLEPDTTYEFFAGALYINDGEILEFTTLPAETIPTPEPTPEPWPPTQPDECIFTTRPATNITSTSATINGYAEVIRYPGQFIMADFAGWLCYRKKGETEWIEGRTQFIWTSTDVKKYLENLEPDTTYEFYAGGAGHLQGEIMEFTTLPETSGDINGDKSIDISDAVMMIEYIGAMATGEALDSSKFPGGKLPCGEFSAKLTADGDIDISDVVLLVEYIGALATGEQLDPDKFPDGKFPGEALQ